MSIAYIRLLCGLTLTLLVTRTLQTDDQVCPEPWPKPSTKYFEDSCSCLNEAELTVRCSKLARWPARTIPSTTNLYLDGTSSNQTLRSYKLAAFAPNLKLFSCNLCGIKTIQKFAFFGLNLLTEIYLDGNDIKTISSFSFSAIPSLRRLTLSNSEIITIESSAFMGLSNMELLSLEQNPLDDIQINAFKNVSRIQTVNLNAIKSTKLLGYRLQGLKHINLISFTHSHINKMYPYAFFGVDNISTINFHSSQLKTLMPNAFVGIGKVKDIRLKNTQISTLPCGALEGLDCVSSVNWAGSPLRCDCNVQWMVELSLNVSRDKTKNLMCASPTMYSGQSPFDMEKDDMQCNDEERFMGCAKLDTRVPRVKPLERYIEEVMALRSSSSSAYLIDLRLLTTITSAFLILYLQGVLYEIG